MEKKYHRVKYSFPIENKHVSTFLAISINFRLLFIYFSDSFNRINNSLFYRAVLFFFFCYSTLSSSIHLFFLRSFCYSRYFRNLWRIYILSKILFIRYKHFQEYLIVSNYINRLQICFARTTFIRKIRTETTRHFKLTIFMMNIIWRIFFI